MDDLQTSSLRFGGVVIPLLAQPGRQASEVLVQQYFHLLLREGHFGGYIRFYRYLERVVSLSKERYSLSYNTIFQSGENRVVLV
jgi:hypothetical protein